MPLPAVLKLFNPARYITAEYGAEYIIQTLHMYFYA